ncbi:zinc finger protein 367-like [Culicoides brevitarsis]|uniref:zinc finger protein 367-like n=1 Tax=Culicoides brevitarsis TaxID=469753 RepID=UPI00307B4EBD
MNLDDSNSFALEQHTPTRVRTSLQTIYSPSDSSGDSSAVLSPNLILNSAGGTFATSFSSPSPSSSSKISPRSSSSSKRGRPKSETLTNLIIEGKDSPSNIKCKYCSRVFPRDKSLNAHERIHLGVKPYICDYPGCTRAFTQSGQLKTHQRLHTGEKPFKCSEPSCNSRFTHANRHCSLHPYSSLIRCEDSVLDQSYIAEQNTEVLKWLEKYRSLRDDRTPKRKKLNATNDENVSGTPVATPTSASSITSPFYEPHHIVNNPKSRKGLMLGELDMNAGQGSPTSSKMHANSYGTPKVIKWQDAEDEEEEEEGDSSSRDLSPINPKKRWLSYAWQEECLAKPLDQSSANVLEANQNRPSVLMIAKRDTVAPVVLDSENLVIK